MEQWRFNRLRKKKEKKLQERIGVKKDTRTMRLIYENTKNKKVNKCYETMWPPLVIKEDLQTTQPNKSLSGDKESWRGGGEKWTGISRQREQIFIL